MAEEKSVLEELISIFAYTETKEAFLETVLKRLESLGYAVDNDDTFMIAFSIKTVESKIKNFCHIGTVPEGLHAAAIDMVCGYFLHDKQQQGQLTDRFDTDAAIKQVQAGDTTVTLADSTQTKEQRLDSLISFLMNRGESEWVCYRKLKW